MLKYTGKVLSQVVKGVREIVALKKGSPRHYEFEGLHVLKCQVVGMSLLLLLLLSHFSHFQLCATPQMAAHQAPLSLGFSRQEHWSGLTFPSPSMKSEK